MKRFTFFLNHGENTIELDDPLFVDYNSNLTVRNVSIFWEHENIRENVNDTFVYNTSTIQIDPGYWTFDLLKSYLKPIGLILDKIEHSSKCVVQVWSGNTANLKTFGQLLGFPIDKSITATSLAKSVNKVEINSGIRYVTISSNAVDRNKNYDFFGKRSQIVATVPITSTQNLSGTVTKFGDLNNAIPLYNAVHPRLHFTVGNNADVKTKMKVLIEIEIK